MPKKITKKKPKEENKSINISKKKKKKILPNKKRKNAQKKENNNNIKRKIKKKKDPLYVSNLDFLDNSSLLSLSDNSFNKVTALEISITASLIYRYTLNQIEIKGEWWETNQGNHQILSYLLQERGSILFPINKHQIDYTNLENTFPLEKYFKDDIYLLNIDICNIIDILLIPNFSIFSQVLNYLTGQYIGFFINQGKTIEDNFFLSFIYDNKNKDSPKLVGSGNNYLGEYELLGNIKFYTNQEEMMKRNMLKARNSNSINKGAFVLGDINLRKIYLKDKK